MDKPIETCMAVVIRTIMILIFVAFLYFIRDVILLLFIAVLLAATIEPAVNWFQGKKVPRWLGVLIIYIIMFAVVGASIYFMIPLLKEQFSDFAKNSPKYLTQIEAPFKRMDVFFQKQNISFDSQQIMGGMEEEVTEFSNNIFSKTIGFFSGFISSVIVLTLVFYMAVEEDGMKKFTMLIVPEKHREYAISLLSRIKIKIAYWVRGQFFIMLSIFVLDFIGLSLIGVPYALFLAIFAGILELIPYAGPVIASVPGIFLGFFISPITGLLAFLVYLIAQQFESHVIIPQIMKRAVGLNPIVTILALLVGAKLGGVLGAILSIPVATALGLFLGDLFNKKEKI